MDASGLCEPAVARVLARAELAYLAVEVGGAPHVTPVLFAAAHDRLWFALARSTLKARAIARRPQVGVLAEDGSAAATIAGTATVLDPARPADLAAVAPELARAPFAAPWFGLQNARELAGFARDAVAEPGRLSPAGLVLVAVEAGAVELTRRPPAARAGGGPSVRSDWKKALERVPAPAAELARRRGPAVLGWVTPSGPLAVPAAWDGDRARVRWSALAPFDAAPAGPAALCLDATSGAGPRAKTGLLLRGHARANGRGELRTVALSPRRVTYWRGFETGTVDAAPAAVSGARAA